MRYGPNEFKYANPIADAIVQNPAFRAWLLGRTKFADTASEARPLPEEMLARRSPGTATWWRSHYAQGCQCAGCKGQETDLLAVFEGKSGGRFALHVEVKNPADGFREKENQAAAYRLRARCWVAKSPARVLPHSDAATMLIFAEAKRREFQRHLPHFDSLVTWEEVEAAFPDICGWLAA